MKQQILVSIALSIVGLIQLVFIESVGILPPGDLWLALNHLLHGVAHTEYELRRIKRFDSRFDIVEAGEQDQQNQQEPELLLTNSQSQAPSARHPMVNVRVEVRLIVHTQD